MVWWDMSQPQAEPDGERTESTGELESDALLASSAMDQPKGESNNNNWWPGLGDGGSAFGLMMLFWSSEKGKKWTCNLGSLPARYLTANASPLVALPVF